MITRSQQDITSNIIAVEGKGDFAQNIKKLVENNTGGEYIIRNAVLYKFNNGKKY